MTRTGKSSIFSGMVYCADCGSKMQYGSSNNREDVYKRQVVVAGGGEETLTAVSTLLAQCSRVGGNLNQLARHFNSGGADTEQLRAKLLEELADLTAFRLHAEKVLGELYGNAEAYRL